MRGAGGVLPAPGFFVMIYGFTFIGAMLLSA